jgi:hypothetical protein
MKMSVILGAVVALCGVFCIVVFSEPSGVLAVIAGMFPLILIRS